MRSLAHVSIATCHGRLGQYDSAIASYRRAEALAPGILDFGNVNHEHGLQLIHLGRFYGAAAFFRRRLEGNNLEKAGGLRSLALLEMYQGRYGTAVEYLREAVRHSRAANVPLTELRNRLFLAGAYGTLGRSGPLRREIDAAWELQAGDDSLAPTWLRLLALQTLELDQMSRTETLLERMRERRTPGHPQDESSIAHLEGVMLARAGRHEEALERLELALTIDGGWRTLILGSVADVYLAAGEADDAARALERILERREIGDEDQETWLFAHLQLAELLDGRGRHEEADSLRGEIRRLWADADEGMEERALARMRAR